MTLSNPAQYISGRTVQEQMNSLIDYVDQRAADVALDAIASDVAQVHQDMLDADADATAAAASAAAAAGTLANAVKKTGEASQSIAGDIAISGDTAIQGQLSVIGGCDLRAPVKIPVTPTNNDDAASKKYVDDADALKISITDINTYAVGLTGIQNVSGTKMFTNGFFESMKASGIIAFELFRYAIVGEMNIFMQIFSRFGSIAGSLKIETSGGAITNMSLNKTVIVSSNLGIFTLYAYVDDGNVVVCVGNRITANSNYNVCILGGCDGAGNSLVPDISNIKTSRSVSGATKVDVF